MGPRDPKRAAHSGASCSHGLTPPQPPRTAGAPRHTPRDTLFKETPPVLTAPRKGRGLLFGPVVEGLGCVRGTGNHSHPGLMSS
ncbi:hypothetical protein SKAU_G00175460 [Synaphobranchus kaupii]|uniref:Uncharacterized protein n=1 Tax=Synaphobranchus kaupii TaxID=118154 RepID=A0A9Q1J083_SYNKA|nr:hypothetical protein SKAU_G00175460 [Synaphobranchus kaupii]